MDWCLLVRGALTVGQGVVADVVRRGVHVHPEDGGDGGGLVRVVVVVGVHGALHGDRPGDVDQEERDGAGHVHDAAAVAADEQ